MYQKKTTRPALPLQDFQRISNAAAGMIFSESGRLVGKCVLFGLMGEWLLRHKYKLNDARAVVGAFAVCVAPMKVIAYAEPNDTNENRQNFHCWVEAEGFVFDFMSFLYPALARESLGVECPAYMFQKQASRAAESISALEAPGDFYFQEASALRSSTLDATLAVPAVRDILDILVGWYKPPPKAMEIIGVAAGGNVVKPVLLQSSILSGAW